MRGFQFAVIGLLFLLGGCASGVFIPSPQDRVTGQGVVTGFRFSGRLAVQQPSGTDTGSIEWSSHGTVSHVELLSPLGSTLAVLDGTPQQLRLVLSDQTVYVASDAEQLTQTVLGYALPLEGLPWWLFGQPAPGAGSARLDPGADGHLARLEQAGWQIAYDNWRSVGNESVPGFLTLRRDALTIRLKISQWEIERADK